MKLPIEYAGGRDMYAKAVECSCLDPRWKDSEVAHLFKTKIRLGGYNDANFWDNVHKEPHHNSCSCGLEFTFQWFRDGVEFNWKDAK